jgi:hypothetical protein
MTHSNHLSLDLSGAKSIRFTVIAMAVALTGTGCSKDGASGDHAPVASTSERASEPSGDDKLSAQCKLDLACCEEIEKAKGAKTADDLRRCKKSPSRKDQECDEDRRWRVAGLESAGKPVPPVCRATKSGLAWEPDNYESMSAACKKVLACCEEVAKANGATSPDDFNLKCSGPAIWKDDECVTDLASRVGGLEKTGKPVPAACK